jgi:hypothetical protein
MYGSLKGFAKFLFDSPSKDNSSQNSSQISTESRYVNRHKLDIGNEVITRVSIAEKAFTVYC